MNKKINKKKEKKRKDTFILKKGEGGGNATKRKKKNFGKKRLKGEVMMRPSFDERLDGNFKRFGEIEKVFVIKGR